MKKVFVIILFFLLSFSSYAACKITPDGYSFFKRTDICLRGNNRVPHCGSEAVSMLSRMEHVSLISLDAVQMGIDRDICDSYNDCIVEWRWRGTSHTFMSIGYFVHDEPGTWLYADDLIECDEGPAHAI